MQVSKKDWDDLNRRLNIAQRDIVRLTQVVVQNRRLIRGVANYASFYFDGLDFDYVDYDRPLISGEDPTDSIVTKAPSEHVVVSLSDLCSNIFQVGI